MFVLYTRKAVTFFKTQHMKQTFGYDLKPKPTIYNGKKYASRLEARWARFFGLMGVPFKYEPYGPSTFPDFKVQGLGDKSIFCEVKNPKFINYDLVERLLDFSVTCGAPVFLLNDQPDFVMYPRYSAHRHCDKCDLVYLDTGDCFLCGGETTYRFGAFQAAFCNRHFKTYDTKDSLMLGQRGIDLPQRRIDPALFSAKYHKAVHGAKTYNYDAEF